VAEDFNVAGAVDHGPSEEGRTLGGGSDAAEAERFARESFDLCAGWRIRARI